MFADDVDEWVAEMIRHDGRGDYIDQHRCARCSHRLQPQQGCEGWSPDFVADSFSDAHFDCHSGTPTVPEPPYDKDAGIFKCTDCNGSQLFCGPCMVAQHADNPLHRLKVSHNIPKFV
jgi:hypothetical protein